MATRRTRVHASPALEALGILCSNGPILGLYIFCFSGDLLPFCQGENTISPFSDVSGPETFTSREAHSAQIGGVTPATA